MQSACALYRTTGRNIVSIGMATVLAQKAYGLKM